MALCRVQSAIPAFWLQSATLALRIRFGTLRQWSRKFPSRIFYPFWAPYCRKLRIGLFDRRATKTLVRSFWPSCDYFPISVLLTNGATNGRLKSLLSLTKLSVLLSATYSATCFGIPNRWAIIVGSWSVGQQMCINAGCAGALLCKMINSQSWNCAGLNTCNTFQKPV